MQEILGIAFVILICGYLLVQWLQSLSPPPPGRTVRRVPFEKEPPEPEPEWCPHGIDVRKCVMCTAEYRERLREIEEEYEKIDDQAREHLRDISLRQGGEGGKEDVVRMYHDPVYKWITGISNSKRTW